MEDLREKTHTEHYEIFRRRRLQEMGFADTGEDNQPVRYVPHVTADMIVPGNLVTVSVVAQNHIHYWVDLALVPWHSSIKLKPLEMTGQDELLTAC